MRCHDMAKNRVEVLIGGSVYALQGDESEAHIQKVARVLNDQLIAIQAAYPKNTLPAAKANMLVAINVADEYLKIREEYLKTKDELRAYMTELEKCNAENLALRERMQELSLEISETREKLGATYYPKTKHENRGR